MKRKFRVLILLSLPSILMLSLVLSCEHEPAGINTLDTVCFEQSVLPIFTSNCTMSRCHGNGDAAAGLELSNYSGIMAGITPNKPTQSRVYKSIILKWGEGVMPPDHALSLAQRTLIRVWIEQGAEETKCTSSVDTLPVGYVNPFACFQRDIQPLLVSNCTMSGCHDGSGGEGGFSLLTYSAVISNGEIHAGNPGESKLYQSITIGGENFMPPAPSTPLSQAQKDSIFSWIARGAKNEACGTICDTTAVTFAGSLWPLMQNSCKGCHSGTNASKGVHIENYSQVAALVVNGSLVNALNGVSPALQMPPSGKMSSCTIRMFEIWITQGYPNN